MNGNGIDASEFVPLGPVGSVSWDERSLLLAVGEEFLRVDVIRADVLRLKISQGGAFDEAPTFAAAFTPQGPVAFQVRQTPELIELATQQLRLRVGRDDSGIDIYRTDGTAVLESQRDALGHSLGYLSLNDGFAISRRARADDSIWGLGQKTGAFERKGRSFSLWNLDVLAPRALERNRLFEKELSLDGKSPRFDPYYTSIPCFQHAVQSGASPSVAGFFIDNGYKANFDFSAEEGLRFQFWGGQYTEYVFAGPTLAEVVEAYTFVTGRMALPPLYALGHHQCRWHDYSHRDVVALGARYRQRDIPCDVLWLDIGHLDAYRVFSWHPQRFPEPEQLLTELQHAGFRCITIVDPGVKYEPGNALFEEGRRHGYFCKTESGQIYSGQVWPGRTAFPDFVKPEVRTWWGELNARHVARGVAGIWNDMNEPATGQVDPFAMRFDRDGQNHSHERYHNQYALLMAMGTLQGLLAAYPERRPFILSRAGFAGIQRVAAQWLGDNASNWEHLAMGIPMALGMGVSGQPFVGSDIPGFSQDATPELAARWFEYGALTPFCRSHNERGNQDHYPWSFGPEVEAVARTALNLRYALLPYLYACFLQTSLSGEPVQRPLLWDFPEDPVARSLEDQYLLGRALLVAPVLAPNQHERELYLPSGTWFDWHSGAKLCGPGEQRVPAPLGRVPLFARGGSVIPVWNPAPQTTLGFFPECVELHVFIPDADLSEQSTLYEDDGLSFGYRRARFLRTELELTRQAGALRLRATVQGNGYPEHRRQRLRLVFHGAEIHAVQVGAERLAVRSGSLTLDNRGENFELVAAL